MTLLKSPFHEVVVADLPEYQFDENVFFELDSPAFQSVVKKKPFIFLFGRFFRDFKNFEKYQHEIRAYFKPVSALQHNVERLAAAARKNSDAVIGVHIRRGDYADFKKGKYFYSPEQYAETMRMLRSNLLGQRVTFIICSNESINPAHFSDLNYITGSGHAVEDLYALAQCDFIMGPPSTFSSWAAFYGNKPLYQIMDVHQPISLRNFVHLPPAILYNF